MIFFLVQHLSEEPNDSYRITELSTYGGFSKNTKPSTAKETGVCNGGSKHSLIEWVW